jgi:hypothetical protein
VKSRLGHVIGATPEHSAIADEGTDVNEPLDLERARLLLVWLQARRALDHCLSDLLAAGPAGERRVRSRLDQVSELEQKAQNAFAAYQASVLSARSATPDGRPGSGPTPTSPPVLRRVRAGNDSG